MGYIVYAKSRKGRIIYGSAGAGKRKSPLAVGSKREADRIKRLMEERRKKLKTSSKWKIKVRKI